MVGLLYKSSSENFPLVIYLKIWQGFCNQIRSFLQLQQVDYTSNDICCHSCFSDATANSQCLDDAFGFFKILWTEKETYTVLLIFSYTRKISRKFLKDSVTVHSQEMTSICPKHIFYAKRTMVLKVCFACGEPKDLVYELPNRLGLQCPSHVPE